MELVRHLLAREDRHVGGEPGVERRDQPVRRDPPIGLEAHDLAFGVGAGVGATGGVDLEVLAGDRLQRSLQLGFDRAAVGLLLPAGESASVVLQHDFDIHFLTSRSSLPGRATPHPDAERVRPPPAGR